MKRLLLIGMMLQIFSTEGLKAASIYSIANGTWSNPNIWSYSTGGAPCGCVPQGSDFTTISHSVTMDKNLTNGGGCLGGINGFLYITAAGSLSGGSGFNIDVLANGILNVYGTLSVNNIEFYNGSLFRFNAGSNVLVNGDFTNRNNSPNIRVDGAVLVQGAFSNGIGAYIAGTGSFIIATGPAINQGTIFTCIGMYPCSSYACIISSICGGQVFLPVEWLGFRVARKETGAFLTWSTASEINSDFFEVEYSEDGSSFHAIERVKAAGNSSTIRNYQCSHLLPIKGTVYYRIREVDVDGNVSFSSTEMLQSGKTLALNVAPNPIADGVLRLSLQDDEVADWQLNLYDKFGRVIYHAGVVSAVGGTVSLQLPDDIQPGCYLLDAANGNNRLFSQVLVQTR